jgi:predicted dinucleotide-binding enzyme
MAQGLGALASVGTVQEAAGTGEMVLMAVPYGALPELGQQLAASLRGKLVIDATNAYEGRDGELAKRVAAQGIGAVSASLLPGARIVRAFNTMSTRTIAEQAGRRGARLAIPIAGDDADALRVVAGLIDDIGLEAVVVGRLDSARLFQTGGPGWQAIGTADELRRRLQLPAR